MSKATGFNPARYRNNPKLIAKYLTHALASDDTAFITRAIGNLARAHGMGLLPKRRTQIAQVYTDRFVGHGPRVQHSFEGADRARRAVGGRAGLVGLKGPLPDGVLKIVASGEREDLNNI